MIDPFGSGLALDRFMAGGVDPMATGGGGVESVFEELRRRAEAAYNAAQAKNPGRPLPPIDYPELRRQAELIASGAGPQIPPERLAAAETHMRELGMPGPMDEPQRARGWSGLGTRFRGEDVPAEDARQARWGAVADAGMALLEGAPGGDLAGGLARGLGAFSGGLEGRLAGTVENRREVARERRQQAATEESIAASRQGRSESAAREGRAGTEFEQTQADRESRIDAMEALVREIEASAEATPEEKARARALFRGGPDLFDDLDKLHAGVVAEAKEEGEFDEETERALRRSQTIYERDPQSRYERGIESRRTAAYEESVRDRGGAGGISPTTLLDDIGQESARVYKELTEQAMKYPGEPRLGYKEGTDLEKLRVEAERIAETRVLERARRLGAGGLGAGTGGGGENVEEGLRQVKDAAYGMGVELSPQDLETIRRDLERGATPAAVMRHLLSGS